MLVPGELLGRPDAAVAGHHYQIVQARLLLDWRAIHDGFRPTADILPARRASDHIATPLNSRREANALGRRYEQEALGSNTSMGNGCDVNASELDNVVL